MNDFPYESCYGRKFLRVDLGMVANLLGFQITLTRVLSRPAQQGEQRLGGTAKLVSYNWEERTWKQRLTKT